MYEPTLRQAQGYLSDVPALMQKVSAFKTQQEFDNANGQELLNEIMTALHELGPEDLTLVCRSDRELHGVVTQAATLLANLRQRRWKINFSCPLCCEESAPTFLPVETVAIDRPEMPDLPLELSGVAMARYMRDLREWLIEAFADLRNGEKLELPMMAIRYGIADIEQMSFCVQQLKSLASLRLRWRELIRTEGAEWDSLQVGCRRAAVISRSTDALLALYTPPEIGHKQGFMQALGSMLIDQFGNVQQLGPDDIDFGPEGFGSDGLL